MPDRGRVRRGAAAAYWVMIWPLFFNPSIHLPCKSAYVRAEWWEGRGERLLRCIFCEVKTQTNERNLAELLVTYFLLVLSPARSQESSEKEGVFWITILKPPITTLCLFYMYEHGCSSATFANIFSSVYMAHRQGMTRNKTLVVYFYYHVVLWPQNWVSRNLVSTPRPNRIYIYIWSPAADS